ncbi:VOC family protein [Heyndrickxia sporothermodurans]|nr:VOC family protein [Heyndrickxia sporothermodurans]
MKYYTNIIDESEITNLIRYGGNEAGEEGTVVKATFSLKGLEFLCIDSNVKHEFTITPSFSIYLTCETEEIDRIYEKLMDGGSALMPLEDYSFSKKFGWINDKFGVSWQLNLPNNYKTKSTDAFRAFLRP